MEFKEKPDAHKSIRIDLSRAIDEKSSIEINDIDDMKFTITLVEEMFKEKGVTYRIKTAKRAFIPAKAAGGGAVIVGASMVMEAAAVAAPIVVATTAIAGAAITGVGAIALAGFAAHRILTPNPDYEVDKYPSDKKIVIKFKK